MAGDQPIPPPALERLLLRRLSAEGPARVPMKIIRYDGASALVRIPHTAVLLARRAWNGAADGVPLRTRKTYGTLRKGKVRMRATGRSPRAESTVHGSGATGPRVRSVPGAEQGE